MSAVPWITLWTDRLVCGTIHISEALLTRWCVFCVCRILPVSSMFFGGCCVLANDHIAHCTIRIENEIDYIENLLPNHFKGNMLVCKSQCEPEINVVYKFRRVPSSETTTIATTTAASCRRKIVSCLIRPNQNVYRTFASIWKWCTAGYEGIWRMKSHHQHSSILRRMEIKLRKIPETALISYIVFAHNSNSMLIRDTVVINLFAFLSSYASIKLFSQPHSIYIYTMKQNPVYKVILALHGTLARSVVRSLAVHVHFLLFHMICRSKVPIFKTSIIHSKRNNSIKPHFAAMITLFPLENKTPIVNT